MKLWMKYLLASAVGYLYASFIPFFSNQIEWFLTASEVITAAVPLLLYPLVFFTLASASASVRFQGQLLRLSARALLWSLCSHIMLVGLGVLIASQVTASPNIPGISPAEISFPHVLDALRLQPLPFWITALSGFFFGLALQPDHERYSHGYHTVNSLGEAFFRITQSASEFLSLGIFVFAGILVFEVQQHPLLTPSSILAVTAVLTSLIGVLLILPLLAMVLCAQRHPFRWIAALGAPWFAAAVSGNYLLASIPLYSNARTNLGAVRSVPSVSLPLFAVFGRGGTAMVTAVITVTVLSFYQGAAPSIMQILLVSSLSIAASCTAWIVPGMELSISVMIVLSLSGMDLPHAAGFAVTSLVLRGAAASLDVMTAGLGTGYTAQMLGAETVPSWKEMQ